MSDDLVNRPRHYIHGSGVECIDIAETMDFCPGNAFKYMWRFREKGGSVDLAKALWYVRREIAFRERDHKEYNELTTLARAMAHESNPVVAMTFWYLVAGDHMRGDGGVELFREAERLIEGLIHDTEPTPR